MEIFYAEADGRRRCYARLRAGERRVLGPLCGGQQNKEIAGLLGISESTVKTHVATMLRVGGFANRVQLARWALLNPSVFRQTKHDGKPVDYVVEVMLHGYGCPCEEATCLALRTAVAA